MTTEIIIAAAAHELLASLLRAGVVVDGTNVTVCDGVSGISITIDARSVTVPPSQATPDRTSLRLTPLMKTILEQLSKDKPMKAEVIAMRIGKNCGGYLRSLLADMVRYGVIKHISRVGYLLP